MSDDLCIDCLHIAVHFNILEPVARRGVCARGNRLVTSSKSELVTCEAPPALAAEAAYGVDASAVCSAVVGPADALINVHIALRSLKPASVSTLSQSFTH